MKGIIFITLNKMVEDTAGITAWESILAEVKPSSGGIYTSVEDYSDEEIFALVAAASSQLDIPAENLVEAFGEYLFDKLNQKYPTFTQQKDNFLGFIETVDGVIHKEVRKLYSNTLLPELMHSYNKDSSMNLVYRSPRKLCLLAEGLIRGAAKYYKTEYSLEHHTCMHNGADQCEFLIRVK
jgi:predicted hydrocarbon binding protein